MEQEKGEGEGLVQYACPWRKSSRVVTESICHLGLTTSSWQIACVKWRIQKGIKRTNCTL